MTQLNLNQTIAKTYTIFALVLLVFVSGCSEFLAQPASLQETNVVNDVPEVPVSPKAWGPTYNSALPAETVSSTTITTRPEYTTVPTRKAWGPTYNDSDLSGVDQTGIVGTTWGPTYTNHQ